MRAGLVFKKKTILFSALLFMVGSFYSFTIQAQLDDPTRPPGHRLALPGGKKAAATRRFIVSSIRLSATRRSAVINDRLVETGEKVNGAKVVAIYPSSVKLKKQGKVFTVRLISRITKIVRTP